MVHELVAYFSDQGFLVHGAQSVGGYQPPSPVANNGFGDGRPRVPAVAGLDKVHLRIVFGIVRETRASLDSEESLTEYNVFLDHNAARGEQASILYVIMPQELINDFTSIITHYIHREYWHRIVPLVGKES